MIRFQQHRTSGCLVWFLKSGDGDIHNLLSTTLSHIPNRRSGTILGQQAFMEMVVVKCVPRYILIAKGEQLADNEWGDIAVEEYVDSLGELTQA